MIPIKGGASGKSRLAVPGVRDHAELSRALALDTIDAVTAAMVSPGAAPIAGGTEDAGQVDIAGMVVVTGDPVVAEAAAHLEATIVPDPGTGLNAAVSAGIAAAAAAHPERGVAVLLGDLPALRPHELLTALEAGAEHDRAVVPDRQGSGTVLLTARPGAGLRPAFGAGSAARHARMATRLDLPLPSLRTDVDDADSLAAARFLGLGPRTRALVCAPSKTRRVSSS